MTELCITDKQADDLRLILEMANESFDFEGDNSYLQNTLDEVLEALNIGRKK